MKKKIVIITLSVLVLIMVIGYSVFSTNLKINGTANIASTWKVVFTKIEEVSKSSGVTVTDTPIASGTSVTFNVDFKLPGDEIIYKVTVANQGTLDAIIQNIASSELGSDAIKFKIDGIKIGDKLAKSTTTTFNITISYDSSITSQPSLTDNKLTLDVTYVQDLGNNIPSSGFDITPIRLSRKILQDNTPQSDTSIDFSKISSDSNGKGLYYTNKNTEDGKTTYYFRGDVKNNYVYFAGYYWRIIRINEDGSIRLIYQGTSPDATGSNATIGNSAFNSMPGDNANVGYMYGKPTTYSDGYGTFSGWAWTSTAGTVKMSETYSFDKTTGIYTLTGTVVNGKYTSDYYNYYTCYSQGITCRHMLKLTEARQNGSNYQVWRAEMHSGYYSTSYEQAHKNEVDSDIKKYLEDWYENHLLSYDDYISDTGFCNDRSIYSGNGIGKTTTYYGSAGRLYYNKTPQFACPEPSHDLFTVDNSKGNGMSQYKVGLITPDEVAYAGGVYNVANSNYYLYTGANYWTMSPFYFHSGSSSARGWLVVLTGDLRDTVVWNGLGVRPVINLSPNVEVTSGNGTSTSPYVIKIN